MRILLLTNKFPYPPKDGGAIATFQMISGLANAGCQLTVLAINTSKHYFDTTKLPAEVAAIAQFHSVYADTCITPLAALRNLFFSHLPYNAERFVLQEFKLKLTELLQSAEFDIIQLEGLYVAPYIPVIRQFSKAKIAFRAHNVEHEIWQRFAAETKNPVKKLYLSIIAHRIARMEQNIIDTYDLLVPITGKDGHYFRDRGNAKPVHVSPAAFDFAKLPASQPAPVALPSLFHIGGLDWPPNQQGLMWFAENCLPTIYKEFPDVRFYIAGRNAPDWLVKKFQHPAIQFIGEVQDAYAFMQQHHIMVVPLLSGSGMRIKIIEGMALGKCIVSTSIGAEGIDYKANDDILIADSAKELINHICQMLDNPQQISTIGQQAAARARLHYNINELSSKLVTFYSENL